MLSARELEILLLVARGLSNSEIGEKLHLANTYSKMDVSGPRGGDYDGPPGGLNHR